MSVAGWHFTLNLAGVGSSLADVSGAMMRRRDFLQLGSGAAVAWSMPAWAQQVSSLPLVAVLLPGSTEGVPERIAAVRKGLQQEGLAEGIHYTLVVRHADGQLGRLPALAKELEAMKPAVFVAAATAVFAVNKLRPEPPMVFTAVSIDPIEHGLAKSYAKPEGMFTGNVMNAQGGEDAIAQKRIALFRELVPNFIHLGMISSKGDNKLSVKEFAGGRRIAAQLGFQATPYAIDTLDELEGAVSAAIRDGVDALYITGEPILITNLRRVVPIILAPGKPTVGPYVEFCRAGALMTYASDILDGVRRAGVYAAKIVQGAKPGDIPIEQADKFTLAVNTKTAQQLGITIPTGILAMADEVIE